MSESFQADGHNAIIYIYICLKITESCSRMEMLPGVVLPVRNTGSYDNSPHIVRTGGHKHRCGPFHLLLSSQACEQKFVTYEIWSVRE
jgi:hypothetical protein